MDCEAGVACAAAGLFAAGVAAAAGLSPSAGVPAALCGELGPTNTMAGCWGLTLLLSGVLPGDSGC